MNGKKYNFCIVTYEAFPNPVTQNLKTFLIENYKADLLYIFHPMSEVKKSIQLTSGFNLFRNNKLIQSENAYQWKAFLLILYIKDVLYTFFWCLKFGKRIDVYFAAGNLNPLIGIFLRELGFIKKVKKVIYISQDYYPIRFQNKFLDWFYFKLDKFCVRFSDETWNVSSMMVKARQEKVGMDPKVFNKQYTVPGCIWFYKTKRLPFAKINRKKIIYRGTLLPHMGVDLAIYALPLILKKIPRVKFEIIGGGEDEDKIRKLSKTLGVSKNVIFHGVITDRGELERILSDAAIGIATFNTDILDEKIKNADPGKIKDYMLLGMPVITTEAVFYSRQIVQDKCGLVIPYRAEDLAEAVIKLLTNKKMLEKYRENAAKFIEKFDCNHILRPNVNRVLR